MQTKHIVEEQRFMLILKTIAAAYQDISVMKMKDARSHMAYSRQFAQRLKSIFESLRTSHKLLEKLEKLEGDKKPLAKVLITANSKFHGDILRKIFEVFINDHETKGDTFLIGSIGKELLMEYENMTNVKLYDIPDDALDSEHLLPLMKELFAYKKIYVYHATFKSILVQDPLTTELANINTLIEDEKQQDTPLFSIPETYLFEPSGEKLVTFLNKNVMISLMRQAILENQLARYASRLKAMDTLLHNIDMRMRTLKKHKQKIKRETQNKKQLERMTGMNLWFH